MAIVAQIGRREAVNVVPALCAIAHWGRNHTLCFSSGKSRLTAFA
jgi:hypothetical protein